MKKIAILSFILLVSVPALLAQRDPGTGPAPLSAMQTNASILPVDGTTTSAADLVEALLGPDVPYTILNASFFQGLDSENQPVSAAGLFRDGLQAGLGLRGGVVMSSGLIHHPFVENAINAQHGLPGDPDLDAISTAPDGTFDAAVLEFQFTAQGDLWPLRIVFGSFEQSNAIIDYDDAFALFVNGTNVALIPGTADAMTVNNFGPAVNEDFFIDGSDSPGNELGWHTTPMGIDVPLVAGQTYTVKLAIADGDDTLVDSFIFLQSPHYPPVPLSGWGLYLALGLILAGAVFMARRWM
jgi:hypothetical protein